MKTTNRMIICAKDIELVTGKVERTARRIMAKIRIKNNKPPSAYITIEEFCEYTGLKEERVRALIQ